MRFEEFSNSRLTAYTVVIALSDHRSVQTVIYADSLSDAWLIASRQYGRENLVSVSSPYQPEQKQNKPEPDSLGFWKKRLRKYSILSKIPSKYHMLFRVRRNKALTQVNREKRSIR